MIIVDKKKEPVITCPYCGREYLPAEIYIPSAFFGHPEDIDRNEFGKLDAYCGTGMDLRESFECESCGKVFDIVADIKFRATSNMASTFTDTYTAPLQSARISLFEGLADDQD